MNDKITVVIGGGTGLGVQASYLRDKINFLTAGVCMTDTGGFSGEMSETFLKCGIKIPDEIISQFPKLIKLITKSGIKIPRLGDFRQVATSLANKVWLADVANIRYQNGASLGNDILVALWMINGFSLVSALSNIKYHLQINPNHFIYPSTEDVVDICARFQDGSIERGEWNIINRDDAKNIVKLFLEPDAQATPELLESLKDADHIFLGPGSQKTSLISSILPGGIKETIAECGATLNLIVNLISQKGQTDGYTAVDHIREIERYLERKIDTAIVNTGVIDSSILKAYSSNGDYEPHPIQLGLLSEKCPDTKIIQGNYIPPLSEVLKFVSSSQSIRPGNVDKSKHILTHDQERLGNTILQIINEQI